MVLKGLSVDQLAMFLLDKVPTDCTAMYLF